MDLPAPKQPLTVAEAKRDLLAWAEAIDSAKPSGKDVATRMVAAGAAGMLAAGLLRRPRVRSNGHAVAKTGLAGVAAWALPVIVRLVASKLR